MYLSLRERTLIQVLYLSIMMESDVAALYGRKWSCHLFVREKYSQIERLSISC
jgi:hypothetical protein